MTTIYIYSTTDLSIAARRSTVNRTNYFAALAPQRGNSGNRPEIIDGWLGTTNDTDRNAHGSFDLDDEESVSMLDDFLSDRNITTTVDEIRKFVSDGFNEEMQLEVENEWIEFGCGKHNYGCAGSEHGWRIVPNDGYVLLDVETDGGCGSDPFECRLEADEIESRLEFIGADFERVEYRDETARGGTDSFTAFVISEEDKEDADVVLKMTEDQVRVVRRVISTSVKAVAKVV